MLRQAGTMKSSDSRFDPISPGRAVNDSEGEAGLRGVLIQTHMCTVSHQSAARLQRSDATPSAVERSAPERPPIKFLSMLETFSENLPSLRPDL
ncbi:hypothetical protein EYF80_011717 [Liparis tanakae]|uniref:Uncharacterized protein n=1 Tax=Liparis tanakae TaxID=230148 RepID=A0A4Z2IJJ8_9TELE|nr:hypothetical protein EYF80_011717 [Liparis tanakae]